MFNFEDQKESNIMAPSKRRENCELIGIERNSSDNSVTFTFREKSTKAILGHREFIPKRLENMTEDEFKKAIGLNVGRIAHICRAFVTEEEFKSVKVEHPNDLSKAEANWMSITKQVGKLLKDKMAAKADMTCALKVVLSKQKDNKYFSALPRVPSFISTTNHPKDFTINPQYDIFEIPVFTPDKEIPTQEGAKPTASEPSAFAGAASNSDF